MGRSSFRLSLLLLALLVAACGRRYKMTNMLPEEIDVTSYIRSGAYRPDSCEGRLDRLVRTGLPRRDAGFNARLVNAYDAFRHSGDSAAMRLPLHDGAIGRRTRYCYTYFPAHDPVDVYRSDVDTGDGPPLPLYIRIDPKGALYGSYALQHWVKNNCGAD